MTRETESMPFSDYPGWSTAGSRSLYVDGGWDEDDYALADIKRSLQTITDTMGKGGVTGLGLVVLTLLGEVIGMGIGYLVWG